MGTSKETCPPPASTVIDDRPFYIEELDMAQGPEHNDVVKHLSTYLDVIVERTGHIHLSDYPVWYRDDDEGWVYRSPDLFLVKPDADLETITPRSLLFVLEVVSTSTKKAEEKDTVQMKARNQKHRVPEYVLYFPQLRDERSLIYYRLNENGRYREVKPNKEGFFESESFPGLSLHLLPPDRWKEGHKVDLYFRGERFPGYQEMMETLKRTAKEKKRAEWEKKRAEWEKEQAEQALAKEKKRTARAIKREKKKKEQETERAEREQKAHRATQQKLLQTQAELERLRRQLKSDI